MPFTGYNSNPRNHFMNRSIIKSILAGKSYESITKLFVLIFERKTK